MSDRMVLLAIYGNPVEAELVRAQLEAEGIRAVVMGTGSGDVFAGLGVGVSNVQLLVPEADRDRAADLLEAAEDDDEDGEAEGSTAIKARRARKPSSTDVRPALDSPVQDRAPSPSEAVAPEANDLPPEEGIPPEEDDERDEPQITYTADDMAARAFRSAIFGFFTCGALHVYALWLVIRLPWAEGELSPTGSRKAVAAAVISVIPGSLFILASLAAVVALVLSLFR